MEKFDVIIIGGGVSGLGVARETVGAGLSTLLLESGMCGGATSNNTLRIIHGGFRYLQSFDLPRVVQSLRDQSALIHEVPNAIKPLPCLMPLTRFGLKSRIPVTCAAILYGAIMRKNRSPLPVPHILSSEKIHSTVKVLRNRAPYGALCWYDGVMSAPELVTSHLTSQITANGGVIREATPVERIEGAAPNFTVHGASEEKWSARSVINTLGPWLDSITIPQELKPTRPLWCKGFNLIIKQQLDPTYGIGIESADGRLFFCVPRGTGTAIGTWYLPYTDPALPPTVSEHEISQFLRAFTQALPEVGVSRNDVTGVDVGILPMAMTSPQGPKLIAHERIHERRGYVEVMSTKYTTFRSQAQTTLAAVKRALTRP